MEFLELLYSIPLIDPLWSTVVFALAANFFQLRTLYLTKKWLSTGNMNYEWNPIVRYFIRRNKANILGLMSVMILLVVPLTFVLLGLNTYTGLPHAPASLVVVGWLFAMLMCFGTMIDFLHDYYIDRKLQTMQKSF